MKPSYTEEEQADILSICTDALSLFLEYRDKHGRSEVEAKIAALSEIAEGLAVSLDDESSKDQKETP